MIPRAFDGGNLAQRRVQLLGGGATERNGVERKICKYDN